MERVGLFPTLLFLVTTACLAGSAGFIAALLRLRSAIAFLLAAYVVAWAELVVLILALSPVRLVTRNVLVPVIVALLPISIIVWQVAGRPRPPSGSDALANLRESLRDRSLAILAAVVALGFAYLTALALFTPANSWDAMWFWLPRAAYWKQQHAVGYIPHANVDIMNAFPPVAGIGVLYSMIVESGDRFVTTVSLLAYVATPIAVFGIARRFRLDARSALFGSLVFATLPVVILQASGALIDLVVASFLAACAYFGLSDRPAEIGLAGVAFALALGAKSTAVFALPILVLVILVGRPRRARMLVFAGLAAGAIGSAWYILNLVRTGSFDGRANRYDLSGDHGVAATLARAMRLLIDFAEAPGAGGWWGATYVGAAVAAATFVWFERRHGHGRAVASSIAAFVGMMPLVVIALAPVLKRGYQWIFFHVGRPDLGLIDQDRGVTGASALASFYGPLGLLLLGSVAVLLVRDVRRRVSCGVRALSAAPVVFLLIAAIALSASPYWGRLFAFPIALAAAGAGVLLRSRPLAWGIVAIAATTLVLTLRANDEKPPNVWGKPRWWVQAKVGGRHNGELALIRFAEESIPIHARVGLAIRMQDWSYPFFGSQLARTIRFVPTPKSASRDLDWLVVGPAMGNPDDGWFRVLDTDDGWQLFRVTP